MFQQGHTPSHKGQMTTTDPIKDLAIVQSIKQRLTGRDLALWTVAVNSALRAGDLCNLTWDDTHDDGTTITLTLLEGKTKKRRVIPLNPETSGFLRSWRARCESVYIYSGQRGRMTTATWGRLVKAWCEETGLKGSFSGHTTRKTWARIQHETFGTSMATLMSALNHSTEKQTMTYIGKLSDDVMKAYSNAL
jgi:integrase